MKPRANNVVASLIVGGMDAAVVAAFDAPTWGWLATWLIVYTVVVGRPLARRPA